MDLIQQLVKIYGFIRAWSSGSSCFNLKYLCNRGLDLGDIMRALHVCYNPKRVEAQGNKKLRDGKQTTKRVPLAD